jgi:beta-N-acetylhexosaminidase
VLHCSGNLTEMTAVAGAVPMLSGEAAKRAEAALAMRSAPQDFDVEAARRLFADMIEQRKRVS